MPLAPITPGRTPGLFEELLRERKPKGFFGKIGQAMLDTNVMGLQPKTGLTLRDIARAVTPQSPQEEVEGIQDVVAPMAAMERGGAKAAGAAGEVVGDMARRLSDLPVKPAKERLWDVAEASFDYPGVGKGGRVPIGELASGYVGTGTDPKRVAALKEAISSPEGYIERLIVDDAGNVVEGQHRLEALRQLWAKDVPVSRVVDLARSYDTKAMTEAVKAAGVGRTDQAKQLVGHALQALVDEGGDVQKVLAEYSLQGYDKAFRAAVRAAKTDGGILGDIGKAVKKVYHGTPHTFPEEPGFPLGRFRSEKIGTGEGAQAFGHGLYVAENPEVAKTYKNALSGTKIEVGGKDYLEDKHWLSLRGKQLVVEHIRQAEGAGLSGSKAALRANETLSEAAKSANSTVARQMVNDAANVAGELAQKEYRLAPGRTYEAALKAADEDFLVWDKPLSEQSEKVQKAVRESYGDVRPVRLKDGSYSMTRVGPDGSGKVIFGISEPTPEAASKAFDGYIEQSSGMSAYNELADGLDVTPGNKAKIASDALSAKGIRGIKYADEGSRVPKAVWADGQAGERGDLLKKIADNYLDIAGTPEKAVQRLRKDAAQLADGRQYTETAEALESGALKVQQATHNYVIFNDEDLEILRMMALAGMLPIGKIHSFKRDTDQ